MAASQGFAVDYRTTVHPLQSATTLVLHVHRDWPGSRCPAEVVLFCVSSPVSVWGDSFARLEWHLCKFEVALFCFSQVFR